MPENPQFHQSFMDGAAQMLVFLGYGDAGRPSAYRMLDVHTVHSTCKSRKVQAGTANANSAGRTHLGGVIRFWSNSIPTIQLIQLNHL